MLRIGIIGVGQIGSAIAKTLARNREYTIIASRRKIEKALELTKLGVRVTSDNREVAANSEIIFVAVKPHKTIKVVREIADLLEDKLLISVAAAIPIKRLAGAAPRAKIVRAMPNIALITRSSFTAYTPGENLTQEDIKLVEEIFSEMGECMKIDEELMNAVTALSGSGPAYVATLIEAMAYAGLKVGLPREFAYKSSAYTVYGTAKLYLETGIHPASIKEMVLTPAGTTIEGIFYLEESGIRTAIMKAVEEATKRAKEIERELNAE